MTLVEIVISGVLACAVAMLAFTAVATVEAVAAAEQAQPQVPVGHEALFKAMREELARCTSAIDPETNETNYRITLDGSGKQVLRFRKLAGAAKGDAEPKAAWSDWIDYSVHPDGIVVRTEGKLERPVAAGIDSLDYEITARGDFRITCRTALIDPHTGEQASRDYIAIVKPLSDPVAERPDRER